jgi:osmotically-inducible protein OsmY
VFLLHVPVLALATALAAGPASPQAPAAVRALLDATKAITVFDHVTATSDRGVVTLSGKVTSRAKREQIETEIATAPGVRQVVNRVKVLPASASDDALRHRVARAIYGHPLFRQYAAMSQPPIRVLVERGRVSLAGGVRSEVERLMARSLAEAEAPGAVEDALAIAR